MSSCHPKKLGTITINNSNRIKMEINIIMEESNRYSRKDCGYIFSNTIRIPRPGNPLKANQRKLVLITIQPNFQGQRALCGTAAFYIESKPTFSAFNRWKIKIICGCYMLWQRFVIIYQDVVFYCRTCSPEDRRDYFWITRGNKFVVKLQTSRPPDLM